jgi:DNA-binding transcriptional regulator YiaG
MGGRTRGLWTAQRVKALRRSLGLTQRDFARELGVRQQTVSEWETGSYAPRGASARVLEVVAERADVAYGSDSAEDQVTNETEDSNQP